MSHHHGIGKIRRRWMNESIGEGGVGMLQAVKSYIDPQNIFASGNLIPSKIKEENTQSPAQNLIISKL